MTTPNYEQAALDALSLATLLLEARQGSTPWTEALMFAQTLVDKDNTLMAATHFLLEALGQSAEHRTATGQPATAADLLQELARSAAADIDLPPEPT